MNRKWFYGMLVGGMLGLLVLQAMVAPSSSFAAQAAPNVDTYDLSWFTIDGGGVTDSSAGGYTLSGTIGQPDDNLLSNGVYVLSGGFWSAVLPYSIFLPVIMR
jgi:hypothetical protein